MRMQLSRGALWLALIGAMAPASTLGEPIAGARVDVYTDEWITVITSGARAGFDATEDTALEAHYAVDQLSGATELFTVDAVSGATRFEENRHEFGLTARTELSPRTTVNTGYTFSVEPDFQTHALSASAAREILDRMATVSAGYRLNVDQIGLRTDATYEQAAYGHALDLSWTQILGRRATLAALITGQMHHCDARLGCHANPYRYVPILSGETLHVALSERHPDLRARIAAALYWTQRLSVGPAWHLGYRFYEDTWSIQGHTGEFALAQGLFTDRLNLRLEGRFTYQTAASFFRDDYGTTARDGLPAFRTADREMSSMYNTLAGGRIEWAMDGAGLRWRARLNARVSRIWYQYLDITERPSRNAWIIGGGASATF